jgi:hypothetical protein
MSKGREELVPMHLVPVSLRLSVHGQLKGHPEIRRVVLSAIPALKKGAALATRGISLIRQLQDAPSNARPVTGVKITGIGKLMI